MKGALMVLGRLSNTRPSSFIAGRSSLLSSSRNETLLLSSAAATASFSTMILTEECNRPFLNMIISSTASPISQSFLRFNHPRSFSTDSSSGKSNIISVESEEQFGDALTKTLDELQPALFYYTAAWCGPCKLLSPVISQLSEKYPHVNVFKIDIDKEDLSRALSKSNVEAVPTIHFFHNGNHASTVVGADVEKLRSTMENLYK